MNISRTVTLSQLAWTRIEQKAAEQGMSVDQALEVIALVGSSIQWSDSRLRSKAAWEATMSDPRLPDAS